MGCHYVGSSWGYISVCCSKLKNKSVSFFYRKNNDYELYKQDIDMGDDGNHSNIMSKEEIKVMIEKNKQYASNMINEYKLIKNTSEATDEESNKNTLDNLYQIKQEVNTIEFEDNKETNNDNNVKEIKPTNESIEILKQEILMTTPEDDL